MKLEKTRKQNISRQNQMQKLDGKLKQASKMYERQFLRQMVKAMRSTVSHSGLTKPSMAENIYREQLDDKYVDSWSDSGGTGFAEMVYQELVDKFYPQLGNQKIKKVRPMSLSDRYQGISRSLTGPKGKKHTFHVKLGSQTKPGPSFLKIPWQGRLESESTLPSGERVAVFSHPFGLKSTLVFQGRPEPGLLNKTLAEGENFALLSPESQSITWQIQDANSRKGSAEQENKGFN